MVYEHARERVDNHQNPLGGWRKSRHILDSFEE